MSDCVVKESIPYLFDLYEMTRTSCLDIIYNDP